MLRTYRTPKGTELPLLNLRGREYLEVKYRLVWFREDHPDWAIETELLSVNENSAYGRAVIKDEHGRIIATSHKFETKKGFPDFIEKAETGAIGRALALIGYGTQFCADELDEGERIVDAPVERRAPASQESRRASANAGASAPLASDDSEPQFGPSRLKDAEPVPEAASEGASQVQPIPKDAGDYRITFGKKYKGLKLRDIPRGELEGYIDWLEDNAAKKGMPLSEEARFLKVAVGRFLQNAPAAGAQSKRAASAGATPEAVADGTRH